MGQKLSKSNDAFLVPHLDRKRHIDEDADVPRKKRFVAVTLDSNNNISFETIDLEPPTDDSDELPEEQHDDLLPFTPVDDSVYHGHLAILHDCYTKSPNRTWVIDFEFQPLATPMWAVPYEISIRTITGEPVLNTRIDYDMTREELVRTIMPHLCRNGNGSVQHMNLVKSRFNRHFKNGRTEGMTIPDIKAVIEALGYDGDFSLLSWGNYVDIGLFHRIMHGHKGPVLQKWPFVPLACHVSQITNRYLPEINSKKLETVHKALCPNSRRRYHEADEDVLAMTEVIKELINRTTPPTS